MLARSAAAAAVFAVAVSALPASAQHMNAADAPCRGAGTTVAADSCFVREAGARDRELAALRSQIVAALDAKEARQFGEAEAHWRRYRAAACEAERGLYAGGTGEWPTYHACLEGLTRSRIKDLRDGYWWRVEKN